MGLWLGIGLSVVDARTPPPAPEEEARVGLAKGGEAAADAGEVRDGEPQPDDQRLAFQGGSPDDR